MNEVVLDTSDVRKWFCEEQRGSGAARELRDDYAVYVALAEERGHPLVTDDHTIVAIAGELMRPLTR